MNELSCQFNNVFIEERNEKEFINFKKVQKKISWKLSSKKIETQTLTVKRKISYHKPTKKFFLYTEIEIFYNLNGSEKYGRVQFLGKHMKFYAGKDKLDYKQVDYFSFFEAFS